MRRRGFTNQQVYLIQDIYRTIYTRGLNNSDALKAIETEYEPSEELSSTSSSLRSAGSSVVPSMSFSFLPFGIKTKTATLFHAR